MVSTCWTLNHSASSKPIKLEFGTHLADVTRTDVGVLPFRLFQSFKMEAVA